MKARELPANPSEHAELVHEMAEIAGEARDPDPRTHLVSSGLAEIKRRAVHLLSLVSRTRSALLALPNEILQRARGAAGRAGR